MQKKLLIVLVLFGLLIFPSRVLAHGEASLQATPSEAAAGAEITLTGTEMEDGEVFSLRLEGLFDAFSLGDATVSGEGFSIVVALPPDASPGLYRVVAVSEEGESVGTEITILPAGTASGSGPAGDFEATAEKMDLDRPRTTASWVLAAGAVFLGGFGGIWLIREE